MRKSLLIQIFIVFTLLFGLGNNASAEYFPDLTVYADEKIQVDSNIVFQTNIPNDKIKSVYSIRWDFGDGNKSVGSQVSHSYSEPGNYKVRLSSKVNGFNDTIEYDVFVYSKAYLILTDYGLDNEKIKHIVKSAKEKNILIKIIEIEGHKGYFDNLSSRNDLFSGVNLDDFSNVILYSQNHLNIQILSEYSQMNNFKSFLNDRSLIVFDQDTSKKKLKLYKREYEIIKPKEIIVTSPATFLLLLDSVNIVEYVKKLNFSLFPFNIINSENSQLRFYDFMSKFINVLILNGIPLNIVVLILLLPIIATIISIFKQVIGLSTFGVYTPTILSFIFMIIGVQFGALTFVFITLLAISSRYALKNFRLSYIPRMAVLISLVAFTLLLYLFAVVKLGIATPSLISISIFPLLVMVTLVEKFVVNTSSSRIKKTLINITEVMILSIVIYCLVGGNINLFGSDYTFHFIRSVILSYPETIVLLVFFNILLGKWTGLRLFEYYQFREVFRKINDGDLTE